MALLMGGQRRWEFASSLAGVSEGYVEKEIGVRMLASWRG